MTTPLTIIVPCFNEEASLPPLFAALDRCRADWAGRWEVRLVFVDDASTDQTAAMLAERERDDARCRVVQHAENRGLSAAILSGLAAAETDRVVSIDADGTYDLQQIPRLLNQLTGDVAVVTASPYHPAGEVRHVPRWRLALSRGASWLYRRAFRTKLHTYTACFRAYRRERVADLSLKFGGFVGTVELLWKLERRGERIVECPAVLDIRRYGQSKLRLARVIAGHLLLFTTLAASRVTQRAVAPPVPLARQPLPGDAP